VRKQKTGGIALPRDVRLVDLEVTCEVTRVEVLAKDKNHEHDTTSGRLDRFDRYLAAAVA
jgi:hypothetical protein